MKHLTCLTIAVALIGCRTPEPTQEAEVSLPSTLMEQIRDTDWQPFSDADYNTDSASKVLRGEMPTVLAYDIAADGYGGLGVRLYGADFREGTDLVFRVRVSGGQLQALELLSVSGTAQRVKLKPYLRLQDDDSYTATLPLEAFYTLDDADRSEVSRLGFVVTGKGTLTVQSIELTRAGALVAETNDSDTASGDGNAKVEAMPSRGVPSGHAIFMHDLTVDGVARIRRHNHEAGAGMKIRYAFVHAGTIGKTLDVEMSKVQTALHQLGDLWVFPMLTGRAEDLPEDETELRALADSASLIGRYPQFAGLHVDISPTTERVRTFLNEINVRLNKPFSATISVHAPPKFVATSDMPVLRGFELADDPDAYRVELKQRAMAFSRAATEAKRRLFIGLPLSATPVEFETRRSQQGDHPSGFTMGHYLSGAIEAANDISSSPSFGGLAGWSLRETPAQDSEASYHPYEIRDRQWIALWRFRQ